MRGTGKRLRTLLGCCALVLMIGTPASAAARESIRMDVVVDGVTTTVAYRKSIDVVRGKSVAITPHSADIKGRDPKYAWEESVQEKDRVRSVVTVYVSSPDTYQCNVDAIGDSAVLSYRASVGINPVDPPTLSIGTGIGSAGALPGEEIIFTAALAGSSGGPVEYGWTVVDAGGDPVDEAAYSRVENGGELRLTVAENGYAWKLYGARAECAVARDGKFLVSADSSALEVGIEIDPSSTRPWNVDNAEPVALKLNSVLGGNAASEDLKYRWQVRTGPNSWSDVAGAEAFSSTVALPDGWSGSSDYRCVVDLRDGDGSKAAASGVFEVRRVEHLLDISDVVALEPGNVLATADGTGIVRAAGKILKPANRSARGTSYTYEVLRKNGENSWSVVCGATVSKDHEAGEAFSLAFTPAEGAFAYKLRATSDAAAGVRDESGPFVVYHINRDPNATKAAGTSAPAAADGNIPVRAGEPILYTLAPEGGTGLWKIDWYEDGRRIEGAEGTRYRDETPAHGKAISARATIADRDERPIAGVEPLFQKFDAPRVELEWDREPADVAIHYREMADGARVELFSVGALGGRGAGYAFSFAFEGREDPESRTGWRPVPYGKFVVAESTFAPFHDFSDGKTARFPLRFRATDGEQEIRTGPISLTVVQDPVLFVDGTDPNTRVRWNEKLRSYGIVLLRGVPSELKAALIGGNFADGDEGVRYAWKWEGGTSEARFWTPPAEWPAGDYGATVEAFAPLTEKNDEKSDEEQTPIAVAGVLVHVLDRVDAHGLLDRASVRPGEPISLTVRVVTRGSGNYEFSAGYEGEPPERLRDDGNQAVRTGPAPMTPGIHALHWRVEDLETGYVDSGVARLTVTAEPDPGPGTIGFRIFPESGALLAPGGSFDMVVVNEGTRKVSASDLTWHGSAPRIATVSPLGGVRVLAGGEVVLTATLKSDARHAASYGIVVPDGPVCALIPPSLIFEEGASVDARFESRPTGAKFGHAGDLPDGLALSGDGHLTGTAPRAGIYALQSITATWPDGRVVTLGPLDIVVAAGDKSDDNKGDHGGGCNGGFAILALASIAFPATMRKKAV